MVLSDLIDWYLNIPTSDMDLQMPANPLRRALCRFVWNLRRWPIGDSHRCGATGSRERPTRVRSMPGQCMERDTLCHQGLSPQSLDSTSIFQLSPPCNRIKAKPFGWTSSSLDPFARQVKTRLLHSQRNVKFHTKRRRTENSWH